MSDATERLRELLGRTPAKLPEPPKERPFTTPEEDEEIRAQCFDMGTWSGLPNHLCKACDAGFIDPAAAVDHWLAYHSGWTPPPVTDIVDTGLVAPSGNAIFKEVEVPPGQEKELEE